jgi:hypothetical protein
MPVQSTPESFTEDWIIQTYDYAGIWVGLARRIWESKILSPERGHPEVAPYLDAIQRAIQQPDIVFESKQRDDTHLFYRLNAGVGRYHGKHLIVVVKYVQENEDRRGYISTTYLSRNVSSGGKILWQRTEQLDT